MDTPDIREVIEEAIEDAGLLLVDMNTVRMGRRTLLRVFVDRPGRVTIGECVRLSKSLEDIIDAGILVDGSYVIEVSSPGIGRQLQTDTDWKRVIGRKLKVEIEEESFEAELKGYNGSALSFDNGRIVPVSMVIKAVEIIH